MFTVEFFRPDGKEVHPAESFPWVRAAGDTLLAEPSGEKVARYSGGVWTDADGTRTNLKNLKGQLDESGQVNRAGRAVPVAFQIMQASVRWRQCLA
jgi:hypothetical protein